MEQILTNLTSSQIISSVLNFFSNRVDSNRIELDVTDPNGKNLKFKGRPEDLVRVMPQIENFIG